MATSTHADVAVIGAGPHALAAIAHLRAESIDTAVFGRPFEFWLKHMPEGMFLRSSHRACHIADPNHRLTLDEYERLHGLRTEDGPLPIGRFVDYGLWFQQAVAPDVDTRRVITVPVIDALDSLSVLAFRQFLIEMSSTVMQGLDTSLTSGAFRVQYIGTLVPLRCGGIAGVCTITNGGVGRVVLH